MNKKYKSYIDWYDNGPGSEAFKHKIKKTEVYYKVRAFERLLELEETEKRHAELVELKNKYFECKENIKTIQSKPIHMLSAEERTKLKCAYSAEIEKMQQAEADLRKFKTDMP